MRRDASEKVRVHRDEMSTESLLRLYEATEPRASSEPRAVTEPLQPYTASTEPYGASRESLQALEETQIWSLHPKPYKARALRVPYTQLLRNGTG